MSISPLSLCSFNSKDLTPPAPAPAKLVTTRPAALGPITLDKAGSPAYIEAINGTASPTPPPS